MRGDRGSLQGSGLFVRLHYESLTKRRNFLTFC